jgi:hypothetical protein
MTLIRSAVLCASLATALSALGCDNTPQPAARFMPPAVTVSAGMPAFKSVKDEVSPDKAKVELRIALSQAPDRDATDALLKDLYRQVMLRMGTGLEPSSVEIYVYANEDRIKSAPDAWLASCVKHQSDKGPAFENKVPQSFPKAVTAALKGDTFTGKLHPMVEIDEAKHHVAITIPYVEPGKDEWAEKLSYNDALVAFVDYAQRLYQNVPDLDGLTYIGQWKDAEVVRINLASKGDYNTLDLYALGERIGGKQGRAFAEAQLTKKSDAQITKEKLAAEKKEYQTALAKLPKGAVTIAKVLLK